MHIHLLLQTYIYRVETATCFLEKTHAFADTLVQLKSIGDECLALINMSSTSTFGRCFLGGIRVAFLVVHQSSSLLEFSCAYVSDFHGN